MPLPIRTPSLAFLCSLAMLTVGGCKDGGEPDLAGPSTPPPYYSDAGAPPPPSDPGTTPPAGDPATGTDAGTGTTPPPPTGDAGAGSVPPPAAAGLCTTAAECPADYICREGRCFGGTCNTEGECPSGYECLGFGAGGGVCQGGVDPCAADGTCNAACGSDPDCTGPSAGTCTITADCPAEYICAVGGRCIGGSCSDAVDCPSGYQCTPIGSDGSGSSVCVGGTGMPPEEECRWDGRCNNACASDPDCGGEHCRADGHCNWFCAEGADPDCSAPGGSSSSCSPSNPCPAGYSCLADGQCAGGTCSDASPCPEDYSCEGFGVSGVRTCVGRPAGSGTGSGGGDAYCNRDGHCNWLCASDPDCI